ncbi:unknown [Crocosphaera subtropica ATCC 51142]|uniref:Glucose-methanol-choline oxidoreductase C-terminal domain-containing protein n=1 Tax=Crocosphaera subtropica (strain ATCC 51142 / BH68) TaxID=43989 RepID=B1WX57_CROS5|nr:GMC family oxidoreductase [Crocosphaera subtropica]ACB50801.1 unknown [Crocosphaera subtropica ATCC 51142]
MPFENNYANLVTEKTQAHTRLIRDYDGSNKDFDFIIIGSGMGGGILADDLADRVGQNKRILVLDVGAFIYPTHVYNISRIPNATIGRHFGVDNFKQSPSDTHFIGEKPQLAFGGRSIFWSGLIPEPQSWELEFFPTRVRQDLATTYFNLASERMNTSRSLGQKAKEIVDHFRQSDLNQDFEIQETPRALHQPYLNPDGTPQDRFFVESTGVFNTAELLINQVGLTPGVDQNGNGLFLKLNSFVEAVNSVPFDWYEVKTTDTITGESLSFYSPKVIIAGGSIESPKLINRSSVYQSLPDAVRKRVGWGLSDHPVSGESQAYVSSLGNSRRIPLSRRDDHAKIIFYSRGQRDQNGHVIYPFNIEMNINHEYWHLRNNDPSAESIADDTSKTRIDIKFSFANCLDDENGIFSDPNDGYIPNISFKRFSFLDDLLQSRFPAIAGWTKSPQEFFDLLNRTRDRVFAEFNDLDLITRDYGGGDGNQWPFGWGTVHHACGTLRMPWKANRNANFNEESVVDEDLKIKGTTGLYVCDMSVMPVSTAANPVCTLAGLALRLSEHLG